MMALRGLRVLELAGLAPVPMLGMMLADAGANVVRIDRVTSGQFVDILARGKRSVALDLKAAAGVATMRRMCKTADVLLSPFRPGVLGSLGLAPSLLLREQPRLIVAHVFGYDADSSMRSAAGHDINYLAMSGLLSLMQTGDRPMPPSNALGDFGGGSAMACVGVLLALLNRERTGHGGEVSLSITSGTAYLGSLLHHIDASDAWGAVPFLRPGACAYYDCYRTSDGRFVAVGAIEPAFFAALLRALSLPASWRAKQHDPSQQDALRHVLAAAFEAHPLAHWEAVFAPGGEFTDACVTPVKTLAEAREWLRGGASVPGPCENLRPDAAATKPLVSNVVEPGMHTMEVLREYGIDDTEVQELLSSGVAMVTTSATPRL